MTILLLITVLLLVLTPHSASSLNSNLINQHSGNNGHLITKSVERSFTPFVKFVTGCANMLDNSLSQCKADDLLTITGENLITSSVDTLVLLIGSSGNRYSCDIQSENATEIVCSLPHVAMADQFDHFKVIIRMASIEVSAGVMCRFASSVSNPMPVVSSAEGCLNPSLDPNLDLILVTHAIRYSRFQPRKYSALFLLCLWPLAVWVFS